MSKKGFINILTLALVLSTILICIVFKNNTDVVLAKKSKNSDELKQIEIQGKKLKRANGWGKPDKPSEFSKFHQRIRTKDGDTKPNYPTNYTVKEFEKALNKTAALKSSNINLNWVERGPGNVSGRTRGLIIDPDDKSKNTWYTGSVGGGIWKTTNAGDSWKCLTDDFPTLSTVCIAMATSNTKVLYAGTGEGHANNDAIVGNGIFKSIDKGETWQQLNSTTNNSDFNFVNSIIIDSDNENRLLASTNTSIQKSFDGGASWHSVYNIGKRVQQIIYHPTNFHVQYATVYGKGVIKSADSGSTWRNSLNDYSGRLELAISPSDPNIIYALNQNSKLYISIDSGEEWAPAEITTGSKDQFLGNQGWYNNAIAVSPNDPTTIFVGGINIYKVQITGKSKTPTPIIIMDTIGTNSFLDFINHGGDYLGGGFEADVEIDTYKNIELRFGPGKSQKAHRFFVPEGRTSGVAASEYTYMNYTIVPFEVWDIENNRQLMVSFRDQDRNGVFNLTEHNDEKLIGREYIWINDVNYASSASFKIRANGGHEYKNIAFGWPVLSDSATWDVSKIPYSKITIKRSEVFVKQLNSKKIADWSGSGAPYVHADIHNIKIAKTDKGVNRIVVANDGGVGFSDNLGASWKNPTNGYNTSQFYGVDKHPYLNRYIGGLQDNGSWISSNNPGSLTEWYETTGGDGFDAVWNTNSANKVISSIYFNQLYTSDDHGISWRYITEGINDNNNTNAPFITQIGYTPSDPDKLYLIGKSGVTISNDFGKNWELTTISSSHWGWFDQGFVEPSIASPDIVWAGSRMSNFGKIHVSKNGGKSFSPTNNYLTTNGSLSGFSTHPTEANTAFALFSIAKNPKVLRTTDLGNTWEDLSGFESEESNNGFPDVAIYSLLVMPHNPSEIWVGSEIGLFISKDDGKNWEYANNGLPAVSIWELKLRGNQIIVATHGRGVWSVEMPELADAIKTPIFLGAGTSPSNLTNIQYKPGNLYDSLMLVIDEKEKIHLNNYNVNSEYNIATIDYSFKNRNYNLQLVAYRNGIKLNSVTKSFKPIRLNEAKEYYKNSFEIDNNDFYGEGFNIIPFNQFGGGMAIHTNHPYPNKSDLTYLLKTPIILINNTSNYQTVLSYKDIPSIESGDANVAFGSVDFYDYVIVEGSSNGINWIPFLKGYDYRNIKTKAQSIGKNINSIPDPRMFINHNIKLQENFKLNDTILIRFRLFSDTYTNGWGWVIDDILIEQSDRTSVILSKGLENKIYPVPCNTELSIELNSNFSNESEITLFDLNGHKLESYLIRNKTTYQINTVDLKPAMYILQIKSGDKIDIKKFEVVK